MTCVSLFLLSGIELLWLSKNTIIGNLMITSVPLYPHHQTFYHNRLPPIKITKNIKHTIIEKEKIDHWKTNKWCSALEIQNNFSQIKKKYNSFLFNQFNQIVDVILCIRCHFFTTTIASVEGSFETTCSTKNTRGTCGTARVKSRAHSEIKLLLFVKFS